MTATDKTLIRLAYLSPVTLENIDAFFREPRQAWHRKEPVAPEAGLREAGISPEEFQRTAQEILLLMSRADDETFTVEEYRPLLDRTHGWVTRLTYPIAAMKPSMTLKMARLLVRRSGKMIGTAYRNYELGWAAQQMYRTLETAGVNLATCPNCERIFERTNRRQFACSDYCRKALSRARGKRESESLIQQV